MIVSIIDALGWNGFIRAAAFTDEGYGGLVFLSVVESLGFLFSFLLTPLCLYKVHTFPFDTAVEMTDKLWYIFIY